MNFRTQLIHAGEKKPLTERAVIQPIFQSSTFEYSGQKDYNDVRYIRLNNTPNHISLGEKLAALEQTETGVVTSSGMSAITTALLALIGEGEHLLAQDNLYGGTYHFLKDQFESFGRKVTFFRLDEVNQLSKYITPKTKGIYVESVSNPLLRIIDLKAVVNFAKQNQLISFIDNTFPSPFNFNPHVIGIDVILHSATKYINGHTDIVAGCILCSKEQLKKVTPLLNHLGGCLDPHACFLMNRGLKTLGVRMEYQNQSSMKLAEALSKIPKMKQVIYPGLLNHPEHGLAKELFRGFGAVISFVYDSSVDDIDARLKKLELAVLAPSLGGVETLVTRPATTSHSGMTKAERDGLGISESLVRVSVGIEDTIDLIRDFRNAFG